jgi:hypothetical protein
MSSSFVRFEPASCSGLGADACVGREGTGGTACAWVCDGGNLKFLSIVPLLLCFMSESGGFGGGRSSSSSSSSIGRCGAADGGVERRIAGRL